MSMLTVATRGSKTTIPFRILSDRYRYPRNRYAVTINDVAGILNIAAGV